MVTVRKKRKNPLIVRLNKWEIPLLLKRTLNLQIKRENLYLLRKSRVKGKICVL